MNSGISIIVPAYNAGKTIERCVHSLLSQTMKDIRIIIVDDASVDNTWAILTELEKISPDKICIIHSDENRGPGGARNIALDYVDTKYIGFVDSDDYVATWFCERAVYEAEKNGYDIVDVGYYDENRDLSVLRTPPDLRGELNDSKRDRLISFGGFLCTKIIRSDLYADNDIRYRENRTLEDSEVLIELIARAGAIGAVEDVSYWYSATEGSLSKDKDAYRYVRDKIDAMEAIYALNDRIDNYDALRNGIEYVMLTMYEYAIERVVLDYEAGGKLDGLKILKRLADTRNKCISQGYDNPYVLDGMSDKTIKLMIQNDRDPKSILKR